MEGNTTVMEYKDYYQVMGLAREASADDVRKAYRRLARKYHPDVNKEADAEARFKALGEAYEVLKDPEKRAAYDRLGANWQAGQEFRPPPDWQGGKGFRDAADAGSAGPGFGPRGGEDFSDFFEGLFRRGFAADGQGAQRAGARDAGLHAHGEDHHAAIQIDLEDAYQGGTRSLNLRIPEIDAQGRVHHRERQIEFAVPKGIRAGQHIRLAGQGGPGLGQGQAGDLYLEVQFRPHARYRVEGRDVYMDLPVAPWEAALGAQVQAPTPTGPLEVTVPAGSTAGRRLRLKGRGIPGATPGDFYYVLQIVMPPADSPQARAAYSQMATQFAGFDPRSSLGVAA